MGTNCFFIKNLSNGGSTEGVKKRTPPLPLIFKIFYNSLDLLVGALRDTPSITFRMLHDRSLPLPKKLSSQNLKPHNKMTRFGC